MDHSDIMHIFMQIFYRFLGVFVLAILFFDDVFVKFDQCIRSILQHLWFYCILLISTTFLFNIRDASQNFMHLYAQLFFTLLRILMATFLYQSTIYFNQFHFKMQVKQLIQIFDCLQKKYKFSMKNNQALGSIILALALIVSASCNYHCPIEHYQGSVISGQLIAAYEGGVIPLSQQSQTQCYDYGLPYEFTNQIDIIIAVHDFQAFYSEDLYFFIKPIRSQDNSKTFISFAIRTQWKYTKWNQISFSFLAEDSSEIDSGYYQLDSGTLTGCKNGKEIQLLLPFRKYFYDGSEIKHKLFLHGFEIHTINQSGSKSPFQIQITESITNKTGIVVTLSVTTITEVNSIFVSYMAYQKTSLSISQGAYSYNPTIENIPSYNPEQHIPKNYARIYGLTGFIINHSIETNIIYETQWNGEGFIFRFGEITNMVQYFTFQYVFFTGSSCQNCPGYMISYNSVCVNYCPSGTYLTDKNTCITCGVGLEWNGVQCVKSCPQGQYINAKTFKCECPPSLYWNGDICIPCLNGKIFVPETKSCQCPVPLRWNGFACANLPDCRGGKVWDVYTYTCKCPQNYYWDSGKNYCDRMPICQGGQVLDMSFKCQCLQNYYWNGQQCIYTNCRGGQVWDGAKCVCKIGSNFNGIMCVQCINGQIWDTKNKVCACESGYKWNGNFCEVSYQCSGNRVWNKTYEQCICPEEHFWSGYTCMPVPKCQDGQYWNQKLQKCICPSNKNWDGTTCVICLLGSVWDQQNLKCICPPGTFQKGKSCQIIQQCSGGKMWMQHLKSCECPLGTQWNGNFCISNPCSKGRIWKQQYKSCVCPQFKVWNGQSCVPPRISCTNGKIWDQSLYACVCPVQTYPEGNTCKSVPVCPENTNYNPINKKCACKYGIQNPSQCKPPSCPSGQIWNGYRCSSISCQPPSYYQNGRCVYDGGSRCNSGYFWNGKQCVFLPNHCPPQTYWHNFSCKPTGICQQGFYQNQKGECLPFPQKCIPPTVWDGLKCSSTNHQCPNGTYYNSNRCEPIVPCKSGYIWNKIRYRCECPFGQIQNGHQCIKCGNQMIYKPQKGCQCPRGTFNIGSKCQKITKQRCNNVPNSIWSNEQCVCKPGFTKAGFQCICHGVQKGNYCDKCSYKPYSEQKNSLCVCKYGYTEINQRCIPNNQFKGSDNPNQCNVGSFFDSQQKMCLACPRGCLSCKDCYTCHICRPGFSYSQETDNCIEYCGDGKRFVLECDDQNNVDGDGCSKDCKIEPGFHCQGGSPDSKDICSYYTPDRIFLKQTGLIRTSESIIINIKVNYLPKELILSNECQNECEKILLIDIIDGDKSAVSVRAKYILNTAYSFAVQIDFGRSYIGVFKCKAKINPSLRSFFKSIDISQGLQIEINPSYLAVADESDEII